jgi:hypothetical protein
LGNRLAELPIAGRWTAAHPAQHLRSPSHSNEAERMLVALRVDTDRRHQDQILVHMNAVDLDHQ